MNTCFTCAAYCALQNDCRRHAPTVFPMPQPQGISFVSVFPPTNKDNWCMEHMTQEKDCGSV